MSVVRGIRIRPGVAAAIRTMILSFGLLGALSRLPPVRSGAGALWERHGLRRAGVRMVREMGLPVDREHLALYRASITSLPPLTLFSDADAVGRMDERAAPFTEAISYADLRVGGVITIGVYIEPPETWSDLLPGLQPVMDEAAARGVVLQPLRDETVFRDAMEAGHIMLFIGHANYGRGLMFASRHGHALVPIPGAVPAVPRRGAPGELPDADPDRLPPDVGRSPEPLPLDHCPLFMHLGCRTETYYGEALAQRHPETSFVLGNYLWDATGFADEGLRLLLSGMVHERTLPEILDRWEARVRPQMLLARARERNRFGVSGPLPDRMLNHRPPVRPAR